MLSQMARESPCATLEKLTIAHVLRARVRFPINTDHLSRFVLNHEYSEQNRNFVVNQRCILSHNVIDLRRLRGHSVRENYMSFRRDSPVSLLPAIRILSNGCEKLIKSCTKCELHVHAPSESILGSRASSTALNKS